MTQIVLMYPKNEFNVANAVRAAACFDVPKVKIVGHRYEPKIGTKRSRIPRPLRMKEFAGVKVRYVKEFDFTGVVVGVELVNYGIPLQSFLHPSSLAGIG